jgi:hypothetical protein
MSYALRLVFLDQYRHPLWYAENILPATVVAGRYDVTRLPEAGLVDVPAEWVFVETALPKTLADSDTPEVAKPVLADVAGSRS